VVSFGQQMGVTFPLLMQGYQTSQAYGAQKNYIYLVDKNGIVQAISMLPATTVSYAQIDSAVKAIADKIPALLNAAVRYREASVPRFQASDMTCGNHAYDVRGRAIIAGQKTTALQQIFLWNGGVKAPAGKILLDKRR
jgi:coenzyme F420-reducing hydrogenase alpha subunit